MTRKQFPRPTLLELEEALPNSVSFLFVREPFERLLSAYRDKLEGLHNKYYKALGEQITKRYRTINKVNIRNLHIHMNKTYSNPVNSAATVPPSTNSFSTSWRTIVRARISTNTGHRSTHFAHRAASISRSSAKRRPSSETASILFAKLDWRRYFSIRCRSTRPIT